MRQALPVYGGGKLPRRSKAEGGKEDKEVKDEERRRRKGGDERGGVERIKAKETSEMDAAGGGITWKGGIGAQSSKAEIGLSGESGVGVNRQGSLEMNGSKLGLFTDGG